MFGPGAVVEADLSGMGNMTEMRAKSALVKEDQDRRLFPQRQDAARHLVAERQKLLKKRNISNLPAQQTKRGQQTIPAQQLTLGPPAVVSSDLSMLGQLAEVAAQAQPLPVQQNVSNPTQQDMLLNQQVGPTQQYPEGPYSHSNTPEQLASAYRLPQGLQVPRPYLLTPEGAVFCEGPPGMINPLPFAAPFCPSSDHNFFRWFEQAKIFTRWKTTPIPDSPLALAKTIDDRDRNVGRPDRLEFPSGWWLVCNNIVVIFSVNQDRHVEHRAYMTGWFELAGLTYVEQSRSRNPSDLISVGIQCMLLAHEKIKRRSLLLFDTMHDQFTPV